MDEKAPINRRRFLTDCLFIGGGLLASLGWVAFAGPSPEPGKKAPSPTPRKPPGELNHRRTGGIVAPPHSSPPPSPRKTPSEKQHKPLPGRVAPPKEGNTKPFPGSLPPPKSPSPKPSPKKK